MASSYYDARHVKATQSADRKKLAAASNGPPGVLAIKLGFEETVALESPMIPDAKGEHVYRYGDASRLAAKKNPRGYVLFTCNAPYVFIPDDEGDRPALAKAAVVKADDQRFAELDAKYLASCHNPLVKSAIAKSRRSSQ